MKSYGEYQANQDQADAEERNAAFYREQAAFAKKAAERQRTIFDRESVILHGQQVGAFAKAGVDTQHSSRFLAQQVMFRQQESQAIKDEGDMNVRLANLRGEQADETARQLRDPTTNLLNMGGNVAQFGSSVL